MDLGVPTGEVLEDLENDIDVGGGAGHHQSGELGTIGFHSESRSSLHLLKNQARFTCEDAAGVGQLDFSPGPVKELGVQVLFELADLLAQGGLADMEPSGGPAEVQLLADGEEVSKVSKLHGE
jgi:hypothetical protein